LGKPELLGKARKIYFLVNFLVHPTPISTFVANKGQSAIRPSGDRTVEIAFSLSTALESGPFFSNVPIADFTL
jgi:hypothetical protein